jgi:hypothetical protein
MDTIIKPNNNDTNQVALDSPVTPNNGTVIQGSPEPVIMQEKKPKHWLGVLLVILVLCAIGGGAYLFKTHTKSGAQTATNSSRSSLNSSSQSSKTSTATATGISPALFKSSQAAQGIAVGYVEAKQVAMRSNPFMGQAYAATNPYEASIFYDNSTSSGNQIFGLTVDSKATAQVTTDQSGASDPVFSSVSQKLAYAQGGCSVAIKGIDDNTATTIKVGSQSSTCYEPSAWSPDGKYLAYVGETETNSTSLGLVDIGSLYIYDLATNSTTMITTPSNFNSVGGYADVFWQDPTDIAVHFVDYGQDASVLKEQVVSINITTQVSTNVVTPANVDYSSVQLVGNTMYAIDTQPQELLAGLETDGNLQAITGSDDFESYLLKTNNDNSAVTDIYGLSGQPGQQSTFSLEHLSPAGGEATKLYAPSGFSAYMLGWGQSYDDIIYMDVVSGQTEIHQYTISDNTDQTLVSNLPLTQ